MAKGISNQGCCKAAERLLPRLAATTPKPAYTKAIGSTKAKPKRAPCQPPLFEPPITLVRIGSIGNMQGVKANNRPIIKKAAIFSSRPEPARRSAMDWSAERLALAEFT